MHKAKWTKVAICGLVVAVVIGAAGVALAQCCAGGGFSCAIPAATNGVAGVSVSTNGMNAATNAAPGVAVAPAEK